MERIRTRLILVATALAATLAFGTAGFILIDDYPPFDAFYMTLITVLTVGYQEIHPLTFHGRVFNSVLLLFGVTVILMATGFLVQTLIELEFKQFFEKRRTKNMIDKLSGHYILCGYGRVGRGAAAELIAANNSVEEIRRFLEADSLGYLSLTGLRESVADHEHNYCYACYTGEYPTELVQIAELMRENPDLG